MALLLALTVDLHCLLLCLLTSLFTIPLESLQLFLEGGTVFCFLLLSTFQSLLPALNLPDELFTLTLSSVLQNCGLCQLMPPGFYLCPVSLLQLREPGLQPLSFTLLLFCLLLFLLTLFPQASGLSLHLSKAAPLLLQGICSPTLLLFQVASGDLQSLLKGLELLLEQGLLLDPFFLLSQMCCSAFSWPSSPVT